MKTFRMIAILLAAAILCPLAVSAYGSEDGMLIITHINTTNSTEGSAVVIAGTHAEKVGEKGNFAWWTVLIFDWDSEQNCFFLKEANTNSNNVDKSSMEIPKYGFAYCICVGNDYSASGGINYITERIQNSNNYAKSLPLGTKAYLYGTSLSAGTVKNNGKNWYDPEFVSESYVKIGTPDEGKTAYNPIASEGELPQLRIVTNHVNSTSYQAGDCNLFDSSFGDYVKNTYDYSWWRCIVFDWTPAEGCYTVLAVDSAAGTGNSKAPVIPKNGFVLLDCSSASQSSVQAAAVGMKAYFYEENGQYLICLNVPEDGKTAVTPANAETIAEAPVIDGSENGAAIKCTPDGMTVTWSAVEGASSYTVSVNLSTPATLGTLTVEPTAVNGTSYTIESGALSVGNAYTVTVSADNSASATAKLYCVSAESMNSALADKTVLAFGDSLTARSGWVAMLGGYLGTEVINAGVGGDTTAAGLARFEKDVLAKEPDIALVCFGMNDQAQLLSGGKPNVSLETYKANMVKIVTELQAIGTDVILIAPHDAYAATGYYTPGSYGLDYAYGNMKDFCEAVRQIALEYGCGLIDIYAETQDEDMSAFLNAGDGIHQSPTGHALWAQYVANYLLAAYDGKDKATVTVTCEDENGNSLTSYTLTAAVGSSLFVPAKAIDGMTCKNGETLLTVNGDTAVTYVYADTSAVSANGDVNGDGEVNLQDYMLVRLTLLQKIELNADETARADVVADGTVTLQDAMLIRYHLLGVLDLNDPSESDEPSSSDATVAEQILALVNEERTANGLNPLVLSKELSAVATLKAEDMATNRYFDHTSPTYGSPFDMMETYGISFGAAGENIAAGQQTAEAVMNAWMNSEGHRENILYRSFTTLGVGVAYGGPYGIYWVQMFIG